ncbi:ferrous iron transporter B [Anaerosporomusa subterranea]|uniref:Ferrous iron transport protein B n=1 Tax=Anaerosporomusa subterranea TaxID=1794912 RepID=A0A154BNX9_ANASB|nr:ferrous iron transport protein B [Anaerosporomusa subterranea]KYZ75642.1 ferrous iron transporter B [Anaerosporomusa subterranea]
MKATHRWTVALAGNPNSGKSTVFNNLTGSSQHVGNYPGVTVEKREGFAGSDNKEFRIVDLPGTYSLTAYSEDEVVARRFIVEEKPDVVANIIDASNLERNLYLTAQLLELEQPTVLVLNMIDVASGRGYSINNKALEEVFASPVVRTVGSRNQGTKEILAACAASAGQQHQSWRIDYGNLESAIEQLSHELTANGEGLRFPVRWLAIKLLENDEEILRLIRDLSAGQTIIHRAAKLRQELQTKNDEDPELTIADRRYQFVGKVLSRILTVQSDKNQTTSDKIDKVLTNRIFGLPIFFALMWLLFNLVFTLAEAPQSWLEDGAAALGTWVGAHMAEGDLRSLLVDGIIGGVGGVIVFLPQILLLFFGIALLEGSGYMARAAFIMDRVLRSVGLHGKSFIPMLLGFGCTVPAVMATRTLENPRDRLVTILVSPFMSCSARLPVYTVLISAFFSKESAGSVLFSIYVLGIVIAVLMARIFRSFLFKGAVEPFVMELPPYHLPTLRSVLIQMWERGVLYLRKAGTIILAVSVLIWFLTNYPSEVQYSKDYDTLITQSQTLFEEQAAKEIAPALQVENIEQHQDFMALLEKAQAIDEDFEKQTAELESDSPEFAAIELAKEEQFAALKAENEKLFSLAERYQELKATAEDEVAALEQEQAAEKLVASYAGRIGQAIEPLVKPLGFDWKISIGLFAGVAAKEVLVSTLGTIYSVGEADETSVALQEALVADPVFSPLVAYTLMVFVLLYSPCFAALAVIRRETNSWKWSLFTMVYTIVVAWVVSFLVYTIGGLLGF